MHPIVRGEHLHRCSARQALMRPTGVVFLFPQPQPVASLLGIREPLAVEQFLVIRAVAAFDEAVLPRAAGSREAVEQLQLGGGLLEGRLSPRMEAEPHGEFEGVVGPDQEKGGSRSRARRSTPATVAEV